jgi:cytochrome P450
MRGVDEIDFFSDATLVPNPHPYFEQLRARGPVTRLPFHNVVAVTGYEEGLAIYRDDERFSAIIAPSGPLPPLPFTPEGDDISDQIEAHRHLMPGGDQVVNLDPPAHTRVKSMLMGLITPKRLKENEEFMWRLADEHIDRFIDTGSVEALSQYAHPFTTMVIGDLLGVPPEDYDKIRLGNSGPPGMIGRGQEGMSDNSLMRIGVYFAQYVAMRRQEPRKDVMSDLAHVRYPDGELAPVEDVVKLASILFAAGQDTTTRVILASLRCLAENPELQLKLRNERQLIPDFIEETLRLEGTVRSHFRLVKTPVRVGDLEVAPGTIIMLLVGAMNRDPRRFDNPYERRLDRKNVRDHVAFGRGIHACPGAPLARAEVKVTLERFFDRISDFRINEKKHGPADAREYQYIPSYLLQGLNQLHLEFDKA